MIDPTQGPRKPAASEPHAPLPQRTDSRQDQEDLPAVKVAERQQQVPSKDPVLDVRLDGETMRLYTELRDPETDRVLMRLPAVYQGDEQSKPKPAGTSFEA
jgi:hypothetical protein